MPKGITYFCTDSHGNTYNRYSSRHLEPIYTFAVVNRDLGTTHATGKAGVNYSATREGAISAGIQVCNAYNWRQQKDPSQPTRVYDLMSLRPYPGRHAFEPK
jgi:hypothetical protein